MSRIGKDWAWSLDAVWLHLVLLPLLLLLSLHVNLQEVFDGLSGMVGLPWD